jgi:hypothetical protein
MEEPVDDPDGRRRRDQAELMAVELTDVLRDAVRAVTGRINRP